MFNAGCRNATVTIVLCLFVLLIGGRGYFQYYETRRTAEYSQIELRRVAEERQTMEAQRHREEIRQAEERERRALLEQHQAAAHLAQRPAAAPTTVEPRLTEEQRIATAASTIISDLGIMREAASRARFNAENRGVDRGATNRDSVTLLLPYLEPKFNSPVYMFRAGWVGLNLRAASISEGVKEILTARARSVGLYAAPDLNTPYAGQDTVWMLAR